MKWILMWVAVSTAGGIATGSAEFESEKACKAGQTSIQSTASQISDELKDYGRRIVRSSCVSSQTGEPAKS